MSRHRNTSYDKSGRVRQLVYHENSSDETSSLEYENFVSEDVNKEIKEVQESDMSSNLFDRNQEMHAPDKK